MQNPFKKLDNFSIDVIIVFVGISLFNFCNFVYQLLSAHKLSVPDFAAFGSIFSLFFVLTAPLITLQIVIAKYCAAYNARGEVGRVRFLLSDLFKKIAIFTIFLFLIFYFISGHIMGILKISVSSAGYIFAGLLASYCLLTFSLAGAQGVEFFWWLSGAYVAGGVVKIALTYLLLSLGYKINGALAGLLISNLIMVVILYFPLKAFVFPKESTERVGYREIFLYLLPVAVSYFCFSVLVSFDMVLVKYYFSPYDSGLYSLAQLVGKIFLFLPFAINTVMIPKASGLAAQNKDTTPILKKSLIYAVALCAVGVLAYNLSPLFILKVISGKPLLDIVSLGRLFSFSMSFFSFVYIQVLYFLAKKDLRFIKYLVAATCLQLFCIILFHQSLVAVQLILCVNAILLFVILLALAFPLKRPHQAAETL